MKNVFRSGVPTTCVGVPAVIVPIVLSKNTFAPADTCLSSAYICTTFAEIFDP